MDIINYPVPKQKYKVLVRCFTFNQKKYIEDALNGFVMQQTNFPFVCLVIDDASTDGEQDVIKKWMESECDMSRAETIDIPTSIVIIVPHKTNESCSFAFYLLKQNLYKAKEEKMRHVTPWREKCEYEAICEGDDYWIDPLKLQKQVKFLDNNPSYSMCFHNAIEHYENVEGRDRIFSNVKDKDYLGYYIFRNWIVPTASVVHRCCVYDSDIYKRVLESPNFIYGDTPLFCACAHIGKIRGFSDIMSVYRRHIGGMTFSTDATTGFRVARHQQEFYNIFGKRYKSPLLISYYYSCSLIRSFLRFNWGRCKEIIEVYPYKEYIALSVIVTPFMYLRYLRKR